MGGESILVCSVNSAIQLRSRRRREDEKEREKNRRNRLTIIANWRDTMSSDEDKPPAPPVRLTSNRGGSGLDQPPDLKPLPKGELMRLFRAIEQTLKRLYELWTWLFSHLHTEPEDTDRKKKTLKNKIKSSKSHSDSKPNISYPMNFEHTVHVGFDAITGEFTVSWTRSKIYRVTRSFALWVFLVEKIYMLNYWYVRSEELEENELYQPEKVTHNWIDMSRDFCWLIPHTSHWIYCTKKALFFCFSSTA